jgi:hypothetical protein
MRFSVRDVVDLKSRGGLLATGKVLDGAVAAGAVLSDGAGRAVEVLGVEFMTPRNRAEGTVTLVLQRTDPSPVITGALLSG